MKRKIVLLALCLMCAGLTACGNETEDKDVSSAAPAAAVEAEGTESALTEGNESAQAEETGAAQAETEVAETSAAAEETAAAQTTEAAQTTAPAETDESALTTEATTAQQTGTASGTLTEAQALEAVKKYCYAEDPTLESKVGSGDYTVYWDVSTNESGEIVVLYRSYTAAELRYYVDPVSGEAYVTELVPGIQDEEQRTGEVIDMRDYVS